MVDIHQLCAVCAWRAACQKKHTIKQTALHCPDFSRDVFLHSEDLGRRPRERHKQVEDVFGSRKK